MILYNVTVKVDPDIEQEWLQWMKKKHMSDIMATGLFTGSRILKLLDQPAEDNSTYIVQYHCESREQYEIYKKDFAPAFRQEYNSKYRDKYVAFRTLMEEI